MPNGQPNIVIIWRDDIGITNLSCYSDGLMGYRTPNIDRIADEGMRFTDSYGEQSCTAGRSAFITGQSVYRTGLSKVGVPGSALGMRAEDPTIAELLKGQGYATGQFGKNHLGDQDEQLPTAHGFDEFFGNLYHLNAEEEPELPDYPRPDDFPNFRKNVGPRGVLRCKANGDGTQAIEDTGPLTKKRMETIDDEIIDGAVGLPSAQGRGGCADLPVGQHHFRTHPKPESRGQAGRWQSPYHDTMVDHDRHVGRVLDKLDELGIADDTIVIYSTDNGPHMNSWPDSAMTPFRSEKNTNWEGAFRVPQIIRWPGKVKAGTISNEIISHIDWLPTFLSAAGAPEVKDQLLDGLTVGEKTFRVHLDSYDFLPYLTGEVEKGPRTEFFYFSDDGDLTAGRYPYPVGPAGEPHGGAAYEPGDPGHLPVGQSEPGGPGHPALWRARPGDVGGWGRQGVACGRPALHGRDRLTRPSSVVDEQAGERDHRGPQDGRGRSHAQC